MECTKLFILLTHIPTSTSYVEIHHPLFTPIPQELGKLSNSLAAQAKEVDFFRTRTEVCGQPELATFPEGAHPASSLLRHAAEHGIPIALTQVMEKEKKEAAICCGNHTSTIKEAESIHAELSKQVQAGHMAVFPLEAVNALHNL